MLVLSILALLFISAVPWWAFVHPAKIILPESLNQAVETEAFRDWLGEQSNWLVWGRQLDGKYYALTKGKLAARKLQKKAESYSNSTIT
jgi:hypothetical protein